MSNEIETDKLSPEEEQRVEAALALSAEDEPTELERENERHALKATLEALDGLDQEQQARILSTAAVFFGVELS